MINEFIRVKHAAGWTKWVSIEDAKQIIRPNVKYFTIEVRTEIVGSDGAMKVSILKNHLTSCNLQSSTTEKTMTDFELGMITSALIMVITAGITYYMAMR